VIFRKLLLFESFMPGLLGVESGIIQDGTQLAVSVALGEHAELLFRAIKIPRKAKQFEEESAGCDIGRPFAEIRSELPLRVPHFAGFEKFFGCFWP